MAEPCEACALVGTRVGNLDVAGQRRRARELRARVHGLPHGAFVILVEVEDVHPADGAHRVNHLVHALVAAGAHGGHHIAGGLGDVHLVDDVPAVARREDAAVGKEVEGHLSVLELVPEVVDKCVVERDLTQVAVLAQVADDCPVAAHGIAHAGMAHQLLRKTGVVAAGARHKLDAPLVRKVEGLAVERRDGLLGRKERVIHIDKDELEHYLSSPTENPVP